MIKRPEFFPKGSRGAELTSSFHNHRYLAASREAIVRRIDPFKGKLYLEFGGKILLDLSAQAGSPAER
jgi:uncharacterized protein (UPF0371 family)